MILTFHTIFSRIFVIYIVFKLRWCYAWSYRKLFSDDVPVWNYLAVRRFASNFAKNILVPSFDRSRSSYEGCHGKGLEHFLFFCLFWNWYHNCMDFNFYAIKLFSNETPYQMRLKFNENKLFYCIQSFEMCKKDFSIDQKKRHLETSINDVPRFLAIFDLHTLSYSITSDFGGYLGPPTYPNIRRH